jgi:FkbM family methyltransferase
MLGSARGLDALLGEACTTVRQAASVARAAHESRTLSLEERMAFGALTARHAEALIEAVRAGELDARALAGLTRHGVDQLNERLRDRLPRPPLPFETVDAALVDRRLGEKSVCVEAPVELRRGATAFTVLVSGGVELWRAATFETKEPETIEWLEQTLRDGDCLYDVGANIGLYTLFALALRPTVSAVAFEPDPVNFHRLCRNLLANGFQPRGLAFPIALSDRVGLGQFCSSRFVAGGSEHWVAPDMSCDRPAELTTGCAVLDLDTFIAQARGVARPPTHLKIDVDGIESRVLSGAAATLVGPTLRHVIVEGRRASVEHVAPLFERAGLRHVRSTRQALDVGEQQLGRHLFARPD